MTIPEHILSIDIETYSSNDLLKGGVYKYVEAEDFEILLLAYSIDYGEVEIIDLAKGEEIYDDLKMVLSYPGWLKTAFNAQFERVCLSKYLGVRLLPDQWECTMVKGAMLGLPFSLGQVGKVLKLDTQKDKAGKSLIRYFSIPYQGRRRYPESDWVKWESFKKYCQRDVEVENAIRKKIDFFSIPEKEKALYDLDQKINDQGIGLDPALIDSAIDFDIHYAQKLSEKAVELTGLDNPNSTAQLKDWIEEKTGVAVPTLNKAAIPGLLEEVEDEEVHEMMEIRSKLSKTSIKKYYSMRECMTKDYKAHGLLQFYGANRTGRWSGRLIQIQNLPRIHIPDIALARDLAENGNRDILHLCYGNVPDVLSQLIRTAFVPSKGNRFIVADFSAIEIIVIAWLANEEWVIREYKGRRKIYEAAASRMLGIPIGLIEKDSPERQKGKIASLACQYGGGVGALIAMGALRMGLDEEELPYIISKWREANPAIVDWWNLLERSAMHVVQNKGAVVNLDKDLTFTTERGFMSITLPSGRKLSYADPKVATNRFGRPGLTYMNLNQTTKRWQRTDTYGGKLAENITQAVARDLLAEALIRLDEANYKIVAHVHDEVILDEPEGRGSLEDVIRIMTLPPEWAKDIPLAADGFESTFYKK